jgi:hypothetical protein
MTELDEPFPATRRADSLVWRHVIAIVISPMILAPLILLSGSMDGFEATVSPLPTFFGLLGSMAPKMYGFCCVIGAGVWICSRLSPKVQHVWTIVPMFAVAGGTVIAAIAWRESDALLQGTAMAIILAPVALTYCLVSGVRWR